MRHHARVFQVDAETMRELLEHIALFAVEARLFASDATFGQVADNALAHARRAVAERVQPKRFEGF